jgi:ribosome assembly protein YihI (activator of Der GTPase)
MSIEKLTAYAMIGAEHQKIQDARIEKIKALMETLSDDEYEQLLLLAKASNDEQMVRDLPIWRAMVKKG